MNTLIEKIENEFRVSHRVVAEQTDNQEKSILDLITRNKNHFEDFGQLRFKIATVENSVGAKNEQKTYYLNEQQATFLMTLLRNSPKVVVFKKALVKAFYELKQKIAIKSIQEDDSYFEKIYFEHQTINIQDPDFRRVLYIVYAGKCFYTNEPLDRNNFHIDHIIPKSKGGRDTVANCVPCIPEYNLQKSDKLLSNSQNIIEGVVSCYADMVIELYNNIKVAKSLKTKHNRVTMQGLKKSVMKEFDERYGEKIMNIFYAEVFGIPYEYNSYEDQSAVLEFLKYHLVSVGSAENEKDYIDEDDLYKNYSNFCWSKGTKILTKNDFLDHLQKYCGADEKVYKFDDAYKRIFNIQVKQGE